MPNNDELEKRYFRTCQDREAYRRAFKVLLSALHAGGNGRQLLIPALSADDEKLRKRKIIWCRQLLDSVNKLLPKDYQIWAGKETKSGR